MGNLRGGDFLKILYKDNKVKMIDFKPKMYTARINLPHM